MYYGETLNCIRTAMIVGLRDEYPDTIHLWPEHKWIIKKVTILGNSSVKYTLNRIAPRPLDSSRLQIELLHSEIFDYFERVNSEPIHDWFTDEKTSKKKIKPKHALGFRAMGSNCKDMEFKTLASAKSYLRKMTTDGSIDIKLGPNHYTQIFVYDALCGGFKRCKEYSDSSDSSVYIKYKVA